MKTVIQVLLCAVIGFVVAILMLNNFTIDIMEYAEVIVITLIGIIIILLGVSLKLYWEVKKLYNTDAKWDEEDEVDLLIYKKFADYSFLVQSSIVLSVLVLCTTVITLQSIVLTIIAIATMIVSYLFTIFMTNLIQLVYPERNIPNLSDSKYAEKLLKISDEGEKHVMLIGFYKSYNLLNVGLLIGIVLSTFYSISTDQSQLFSIIVMGLVLVIVNGKYCFSIRNK
ncbi:Protein of unknown function [Psychrobacillus psychrotolerans]|uniref:DUF3169 family protein n=2 Tax=Psychrobacillus psychrotolerans TaxID=126156 RepID=A0A1I6A0V4_9BACI|nr:DUF3169 family protein [Psychrobacillus psychrotolerans]SFQ62315.1 Protein of unknown function [Psychrobacillus psychrotolerans]